jgi:Ca-activated chloride channel family protein
MIARLVAALVGAATLSAQSAQVFRGGTDVVLLSVTVTDASGRHAAGLSKDDFYVFEDGVAQTITHFAAQAEPVSLSLLIDSSISMELDSRMALAQRAAIGFINRLGPADIAQVVDFDTQTRVLAPFTSDKAVLEKAVRQIKPGGATSLYNAIYTSLSELRNEARDSHDKGPRRRAIVLLSDGEDTRSILPYEEVLDLGRRTDVNVYAVAMAAQDSARSSGWNEAQFVLKSLTRDAGGRVFFVTDPEQLPAIYQQIWEELAHQYSVGYISRNTKRDAAWRRVTVQVRKGGVTPRTRAGYYAPAAAR